MIRCDNCGLEAIAGPRQRAVVFGTDTALCGGCSYPTQPKGEPCEWLKEAKVGQLEEAIESVECWITGVLEEFGMAVDDRDRLMKARGECKDAGHMLEGDYCIVCHEEDLEPN